MWNIGCVAAKTRNVQFAVPQKESTLGPALDVLMDHFAGLGDSFLWRKIFELGMPVLAANPDLARVPTTPTPEALQSLLASHSPGMRGPPATSPIAGTQTVDPDAAPSVDSKGVVTPPKMPWGIKGQPRQDPPSESGRGKRKR